MGLDPEQVTIVTLLFAIGAAGLRKVWIWGWVYSEREKALLDMTRDRDFWRDLALQLLTTNEKAIEVAAKGTKDE